MERNVSNAAAAAALQHGRELVSVCFPETHFSSRDLNQADLKQRFLPGLHRSFVNKSEVRNAAVICVLALLSLTEGKKTKRFALEGSLLHADTKESFLLLRHDLSTINNPLPLRGAATCCCFHSNPLNLQI